MMNEQIIRIISAMRRYFPFPGQSLSPKEIEERQERIRRIAEEATSESGNDEEAILSIIGQLKNEKTKTKDDSQRQFIKGVIRKLRDALKH